jgi:two-component system OmpR family response regulator
VPVILLTALAEESDRVLGLEIGADDYLIKPFSPRELLARIRAVLRRAPHQLAVHRDGGVRQYRFGGWTLEPGRRTLLDASGVLVSLTGGEYDLLVALARNPGRVLGRDQLLELTRGRAAQAFDRSVDVQMSRLRRKLGDPDLIKTVRGGGYLLSAEVAVDDE